MRVYEVSTKTARRAYSLYRRGVRAVEICNILFPEHIREPNDRKRNFVMRVLQYYGFAVTSDERATRARMYSTGKRNRIRTWKVRSKWAMGDVAKGSK